MQVEQNNVAIANEDSNNRDQPDDLLRQELCSEASVFIVDPQFRISWANEGFYRQNLTHPHEVLGQAAQQFLPKRYFTEQTHESVALGHIRSLLINGEVCRAEASHYRRDGTSFWVSLDFAPVTDANGVMTSCFVLQRDITVLRERRLQLHRTAMIARYTNNPVVITGPDFVVEWVNDAWVRCTGFEQDEIRGRETRDLLSGPDTDEAQVLEAYKTVRGGGCASYEVTYYRKDGKPFVVAVDAHPVESEIGNEKNYFAVYRDVTESRRMRDELLRMAMVAQYTENGVLITDNRGQVEWINRGFSALLGYALSDLEGQDARTVLHKPDEIDWTDVHRQLLQRQSLSCTARFVNSEGESRQLDIDMSPIFDDEGNLLNVIVIQRRKAPLMDDESTRH